MALPKDFIIPPKQRRELEKRMQTSRTHSVTRTERKGGKTFKVVGKMNAQGQPVWTQKELKS